MKANQTLNCLLSTTISLNDACKSIVKNLTADLENSRIAYGTLRKDREISVSGDSQHESWYNSTTHTLHTTWAHGKQGVNLTGVITARDLPLATYLLAVVTDASGARVIAWSHCRIFNNEGLMRTQLILTLNRGDPPLSSTFMTPLGNGRVKMPQPGQECNGLAAAILRHHIQKSPLNSSQSVGNSSQDLSSPCKFIFNESQEEQNPRHEESLGELSISLLFQSQSKSSNPRQSPTHKITDDIIYLEESDDLRILEHPEPSAPTPQRQHQTTAAKSLKQTTNKSIRSEKHKDLNSPPISKGAGTAPITLEIRRLLNEAQDYVLKDLPIHSKTMLWASRKTLLNICQQNPDALPNNTLPLLVRSTPWGQPFASSELRELLRQWPPPKSPMTALQLLDVRSPEQFVREKAVEILDRYISDDHLFQLMLQLVQALKIETTHDSALARFLLRRAVSNTRLIGHALFWSLSAEVQVLTPNSPMGQRLLKLMETYLYNCGDHREVQNASLHLLSFCL